MLASFAEGGDDLSASNLSGIEVRVGELLAQDYDLAQRSFTRLEVCDRRRAHECIEQLTLAFDAICGCFQDPPTSTIGTARDILRKMAARAIVSMWSLSLYELTRARKHHWGALLLFRLPPFWTQEARERHAQLLEEHDRAVEICENEDLLTACVHDDQRFRDSVNKWERVLDETREFLADLRPQRLQSAAFAMAMSLLCLLLGLIIGVVL